MLMLLCVGGDARLFARIGANDCVAGATASWRSWWIATHGTNIRVCYNNNNNHNNNSNNNNNLIVFSSLFACADDGAYCWRKNCQDCETGLFLIPNHHNTHHQWHYSWQTNAIVGTTIGAGVNGGGWLRRQHLQCCVAFCARRARHCTQSSLLFVLCRLTSCLCLKVVSLREQIDMRVILDAEYRLAVSQVISKLKKNSF